MAWEIKATGTPAEVVGQLSAIVRPADQSRTGLRQFEAARAALIAQATVYQDSGIDRQISVAAVGESEPGGPSGFSVKLAIEIVEAA